MSSSSGKTKIQKEILDQVLKLSEKRRDDAARKEKLRDDADRNIPVPQEPQPESGGKYVPSSNFYKVFSEIVGEDTRTKKVVHPRKADEVEHVPRGLNKKTEPSKKMQKTEEQEKKIKETKESFKPSIFERLSHQTKDEDEVEDITLDLNKKSDVSQELKKSDKQDDEQKEAKRSAQPSIFERLSRRKREEEPL